MHNSKKEKYICPICGYPELDEPPWGEDGKSPSFNVCPCCGCEFGYEDATPETANNYRKKWLKNGGKWFDRGLKPIDWDLEKQLKNIGITLSKIGTATIIYTPLSYMSG